MSEAGQPHGRELTVDVRATYRYLLYEPPAAGNSRDDRPPLVFFFHGKGERGSDLRALERHGLPRLIAAGRPFPFVVISPQCPADEYWTDVPGLSEFVATAIARHGADPDRVYLTGASMGGFAVWMLAQRHPERYAAIAPICGGGDVRWGTRLRGLPVWVFHGANDEIIPPGRSFEMVESLRAAGGHPRFTLYPDTGHDAWTAAYDDPALYAWLLSHRRRSP